MADSSRCDRVTGRVRSRLWQALEVRLTAATAVRCRTVRPPREAVDLSARNKREGRQSVYQRIPVLRHISFTNREALSTLPHGGRDHQPSRLSRAKVGHGELASRRSLTFGRAAHSRSHGRIDQSSEHAAVHGAGGVEVSFVDLNLKTCLAVLGCWGIGADERGKSGISGGHDRRLPVTQSTPRQPLN